MEFSNRPVAGVDGLAETEAAIARTEAEIEAGEHVGLGRINRKADQATEIERLEAAVRGADAPVAEAGPVDGLTRQQRRALARKGSRAA